MPLSPAVLGAVTCDAPRFDVRRLYLNGEAGAVYDPSDLTPEKVAWALANPGFTSAQFLAAFPTHSLYQDSAGTTPVTGLGQPVGRVLDTSGRGNHAIQATSASRPLLDARVNLLVATATLSTQSVTTGATSYQLQFSGAGTITLSGTATGTLSAGTHTITATAGTLTLTVSGTVTDADLRLAADTAYPYQRVTTATDYADVGAPRSFLFDGVDDFLVTAANMDLSGTDKVTVFAGAQKNSDATIGVICEHTSASTTDVLFAIFAPRANATANYSFRSRGTTTTVDATSPSTFAAPGTHVLTGQADTGAPLTSLRINGTEQATSATVHGATNYRSDLLYIGRRFSATIPFNGKLYQLIVRGAATDAGTLVQAERYVAQRTGITL